MKSGYYHTSSTRKEDDDEVFVRSRVLRARLARTLAAPSDEDQEDALMRLALEVDAQRLVNRRSGL